MTAFLNIALLVIGTAATLAAFGGKTWNEGSDPILTRINSRGWISLICLGLALAIGTLKEVRTQREDARKEKAATDEKAESARKQAEQSAELEKTRLQLKGLQKIDELTQDRLSETRTTLEDVRGNLSKAHDELDRQGDVNLITALSNSDQQVKDVQFFIPFTDKGTSASTFHEALLPTSLSNDCRNQTEVDVKLLLGKSGSELMQYQPNDDKDRHAHFEHSPPKADVLFHPAGTGDDDDVNEMANINTTAGFIRQRTSNYHAIGIVIHVLNEHESAAHFLYPLRVFSDYPITITAAPVWNEDILRQGRHLPKLSAVCDAQVGRYFGTAFEKAYAGITLSQRTNMTIYFRLKALKPEKNLFGAWRLSFAIDSKPLVFVNDEFAGLLNVNWPDNK